MFLKMTNLRVGIGDEVTQEIERYKWRDRACHERRGKRVSRGRSQESQRLSSWSVEKKILGLAAWRSLVIFGRTVLTRMGTLVQLPQNEDFIEKKWESQRKAVL